MVTLWISNNTRISDRPSTAQPADSLKSSLSKLLRRDNKNASSESKTLGSVSSVCDLQAQPPGTSARYAEIFGDPPFDKSVLTNQLKKSRSRSIARAGPAKAPVKPASNSNHVFSSSPNTAKPPGVTQYKCIICQEQLSSKGVCKRHLDEQHVAPDVYKCERCGDRFDVKKVAKKHVDACGKGVFLYTIIKPDQKKIYACEFTGESFVSKSKYVDHLLGLSEQSEDRPSANQRLKLCALLDQPGLRSQVAEISSRKFESRHAWKNLQWSDAHVVKAIEELEHATVREDGTNIELGKSQTQKSVRIYLNSLLGAGNLPRSTSQRSRRSRSSTLTQRLAPQSSESGRATPTQEMHPVPQIPLSHHSSVEALSTNYHPPVAAPEAVMATMSTEIRSKRPLSEQSRAFDPGRMPPGPPMVSQMTYGVNPSMPDLQQYAMPNTSTSTLAIRTQEATSMIDQTVGEMYSQRTGSTATPTLSSDAASESTLMSNLQEPEYIDQTPIDYNYNNFWNAQQSAPNYPFIFSNMNYGMPDPQYFYPSGDPSIRTSSVATDQTYVMDYNEQEQKLANFESFPSHNAAQYGTTFLLEGDDDFYDPRGLS